MKPIRTDRASRPVGPYSQAVVANGFVFVSGIPPLDPDTGEVVAGDIRVQTRRCMDNLKTVIEASGCAMTDVVKMMVYLTDMADYQAMNEVYRTYFDPDALPARTAPQVVCLPKAGARLAVDAIVAIPNGGGS